MPAWTLFFFSHFNLLVIIDMGLIIYKPAACNEITGPSFHWWWHVYIYLLEMLFKQSTAVVSGFCALSLFHWPHQQFVEWGVGGGVRAIGSGCDL